jgi:spore photoproduct lyase
VFKGDFFRKCPGTKGKVCCNYYVIDQTTNCPYDCSYCFLQSYLNLRAIKFAVNIEDLFNELKPIAESGKFFRVGTGELSDSLALEPVTKFGEKLINFFKSYPNVVLELKTKSKNVYSLPNVNDYNASFVIGFTLSPENVVKNEELLTASLQERLEASKVAAQKGYKIALHFDPVIFMENAINEYENLIEKIFKIHKKLAWLSVAGFRYEPKLKYFIEKRFENSFLINGEFIKCSDDKFRYLFPERVKFYRKIIKKVEQLSPETPLYFCMEDAKTWETCFEKNPLQTAKMQCLFS